MSCIHKKKLNYSGFCSVANFYCTFEQEANCKRKKQTHFDRIKAMSVEEMAELLVSYEADMDCYFIYGGKGRKFYNRDNAISAEIQYLESEVQEDEICTSI